MSRKRQAERVGEVRLAAESIEALAMLLAEFASAPRVPEQPPPPRRLLSAAEVAAWWGVERSWVYTHAKALGARRLGSGPRPRLRFDPDEVAEALGAPPVDGRRPPDLRRSAPIGGDSHPTRFRGRVELLSSGKTESGRGDGATPPGPAPKDVLRREEKPSPAGPPRRRRPRRRSKRR